MTSSHLWAKCMLCPELSLIHSLRQISTHVCSQRQNCLLNACRQSNDAAPQLFDELSTKDVVTLLGMPFSLGIGKRGSSRNQIGFHAIPTWNIAYMIVLMQGGLFEVMPGRIVSTCTIVITISPFNRMPCKIAFVDTDD